MLLSSRQAKRMDIVIMNTSNSKIVDSGEIVHMCSGSLIRTRLYCPLARVRCGFQNHYAAINILGFLKHLYWLSRGTDVALVGILKTPSEIIFFLDWLLKSA